MSFSYGRNTSAVGIAPEPGVDGLYAPRRTVLDPLLVDAAIEAGAQVEYGVTLEMVMRGEITDAISVAALLRIAAQKIIRADTT